MTGSGNEFEVRSSVGHRFYVRGSVFVHASEIPIGSVLLNHRGSPVELLARDIESEPVPVYNFEVDQAHTYYVGESAECSVLGHNEDCYNWHTENSSSLKKLYGKEGSAFGDNLAKERAQLLKDGTDAAKAAYTEIAIDAAGGKAVKILWFFSKLRKGKKAIEAAEEAIKHGDEAVDATRSTKKIVEGVKLTGGGKRKLGNLADMKDKNLADAIRERGGNQSQIRQLKDGLEHKKFGDVANLAAQGDANAETAIKLLKQTPKKAQAHRNK